MTDSAFTTAPGGNYLLRRSRRHDVRFDLRRLLGGAAKVGSGVCLPSPMDGGLASERKDGADQGPEEGLLSTLDAAGPITPDPFLAEVARIPERASVHG